MWRATHPLFRNDFLYQFTNKYKESKEMTKECRTYIQDVINKTKQKTLESLTLKEARSFCDYLCCINERHMPISNDEMQNELLSTMFAVSFFLYR